MTTSERYTNFGRIRRGVAVVGLLMLAGAGIGSVQAVSPAGAATKSRFAASAGAPSKGAHEGIGVHGHWTIDVKNQDGTLARHVEFENGLCIGSGDVFLTRLLAGSTADGAAAGGWQIVLGGPAIPTGAATAQACHDAALANLEGFYPYFIIMQTNYSSSLCVFANPTCFATLTPPSISGGSLTLAGQFTVPAGSSGAQITTVSTQVTSCLVSLGLTAAGCLSQLPNASFTAAYLTGVAPMPAAITVVAGQSVSVNVQLSFH